MQTFTNYKTRIATRFALNRHVRKHFPGATHTTAFVGRCYHAGIFTDKFASPKLYQTYLAYRHDLYDKIFTRAIAAANRTIARYPGQQGLGLPPQYYLTARDCDCYDRLVAIASRRVRRYTALITPSARLVHHAAPIPQA